MMLVSLSQWQMANSVLASVCDHSVLFFFFFMITLLWKMKYGVLLLISQYRLWGDHGQEALESAHVCVINATATGTEILKNLVLPGK